MEFPAIDSKIGCKVIKKLRCSIHNYEWGRLGEDSLVGKMLALNSGAPIEPNKPHAEFWMGTHDSGPSYVIDCSNPTSLKTWLSQNPEVLGDKVIETWGCDIPFLVKIISVEKALSIQAHPDKELAKILHESHPNVYKDDNHKPEIAIAITDFEALCGFISVEELKTVLNIVPEIVELVSTADVNNMLHINEDTKENAKPILQSIFTQLMMASKDVISNAISKMKNRLHAQTQLSEKEQLVLLLDKQYPEDVGVLSAFFFNYVKLKPGEALYLAANEPHAYLRGECIECMATSDNVVRAGLTHKHKDIQTLCSMLTYKQGLPDILQGNHINSYIKRYLPPLDEFEVDCCMLPHGASTELPAVSGPSIYVVLSGKGTIHCGDDEDIVKEGDVLFAPHNTEIRITSSTSELSVYRAGVNTRFF